MEREEPRARLLMTMPEVNDVVALGLPAAPADLGRFRDGGHAASYRGLLPSTRRSCQRRHHGRITKAGNDRTRRLLTQAARHVARHAGPLEAFYRRLARRKRRQLAITAVAPRPVTAAFLMLENAEP